jgi:uncharacterized membrane protein YbhN (UPF0104 family)
MSAEGTMSNEFWIGLAANAVVTIVLGVVATIIAPITAAKVANFFYARKMTRTLKLKQNELRDYERIKAFHEGKKDKVFFYVFLATVAVLFFIGASLCFILAALGVANNYIEHVQLIIAVLIGCLCALLGMLIMAGMQKTANNLENFSDYEKRVKERWPDA